MVKLQRLFNTKYEVDYPLPNGTRLHYEWRPATDKYDSIVEVEDMVFEYIKYNTNVLKSGKLVIVDEEVKKENEYLLEGTKKTYSVKEVKKLLEGNEKALKEVLEMVKNDRDTIGYFCSVARDIKLDSSRKKALLGKYLGLAPELIFEVETI